MNKVKGYINEIAPQIIKELEKGFSLTKDYQLFKKDKARINEIIKSKDIFRAILRVDSYHIRLNVDAHYPVDEHSVAYYDNSIYLWDVRDCKAFDIEHRELVNYEQLKNAEIELPKLREKKQEISSRISKLERLLGR
jgi:hypothetical protein